MCADQLNAKSTEYSLSDFYRQFDHGYSANRLNLNVFSEKGGVESNGLFLVLSDGDDESDKRRKISQLFSSYIRNPGIQWITKNRFSENQLFVFLFGQVPFCNFELRVVKGKKGRLSFTGSYPDLSPLEQPVPAQHWPSSIQAWNKVLKYFSSLGPDVMRLDDRACYQIVDQEPIPVWEFIVRAGGFSFRVLGDELRVYEVQKRWLDGVAGKVQSYHQNPKDGVLETYDVDLSGTGYLENDELQTDTNTNHRNKTSGIPRAFSDSNEFIFNPDGIQFAEASVFVHAYNMLAYFKNLGFKYSEINPMKLVVHALFDGEKNNAQYDPPSSVVDKHPTISVGSGDGKILKNLPFDGDVIKHEFTHHVVTQTLKDVIGEALILHEGLADYFTFASTNDACLGESICPEGSGLCIIKAENTDPEAKSCLRTGELDLKYNDARYRKYGFHTKGQLISGFLWNLRAELTDEVFTPVVYKALSFLVRDSGFKDFLISLLLADLALNEAKNACVIYQRALERSFDEFLVNINCENSDAWEAPVYDPVQPAVTESSGSDDDSDSGGGSSLFGCGVLGGRDLPEGKNLPLTLVFMIPFLVVLILKRRNTYAK